MSMHPVDYPYEVEEMRLLFAYANAHDVEHEGCYDARGAAIILWSHPWTTTDLRRQSTTIGTWYFHWADENRMTDIECDPGWTVPDLLQALVHLEQGALGYVKYGVRQEAQP